MHRADAACLGISRELQVHAGIIDRADDIGFPLVDRPLHRALHPQEEENVPQDLLDADHGQVLRPEPVIAVPAHLVSDKPPADLPCVDLAAFLARQKEYSHGLTGAGGNPLSMPTMAMPCRLA